MPTVLFDLLRRVGAGADLVLLVGGSELAFDSCIFICCFQWQIIYRGVNKGLYVLLSRTQAGPGRTVKQEVEEISRNHVQTFISPSVQAVLSPLALERVEKECEEEADKQGRRKTTCVVEH